MFPYLSNIVINYDIIIKNIYLWRVITMYKYKDVLNDCKDWNGNYQRHILNAFSMIDKLIRYDDIMFGFVKNYDSIKSTNSTTQNDDPLDVKIIFLLGIK